MTCRAAVRPTYQEDRKHVLSFGAVTEEQEARGVHMVCTRCQGEFKTQQEWFENPECPTCRPGAHIWYTMLHCQCGQKGWGR